MRLPIFQVDAFTDKIFGGNPAAVCPLDNQLPDDVMQKIDRTVDLNNLAICKIFDKWAEQPTIQMKAYKPIIWGVMTTLNILRSVWFGI